MYGCGCMGLGRAVLCAQLASINLLLTATHCHSLSLTATHCHSLPLTATHCHSLPLTATHCYSLPVTTTHYHSLSLTATHCNSLPLTATHCHSLSLTHCHSLGGALPDRPEIRQSSRLGRERCVSSVYPLYLLYCCTAYPSLSIGSVVRTAYPSLSICLSAVPAQSFVYCCAALSSHIRLQCFSNELFFILTCCTALI